LRRLQTDVIDLYQMHWPPEDSGRVLEDAWGAMVDLQKEGKVRWIGVSNFSAEQMDRTSKVAPITSLQAALFDDSKKIEESVLPFCESHGVGVIFLRADGVGTFDRGDDEGAGRGFACG